MRKPPHLSVVREPEPEPEESFETLAIKNTVNLVVARAAIRVVRLRLLQEARGCRLLMSKAHEEFPDPDDCRIGLGILQGKQIAYREAARKLRGLDK